MNNTFSIRQCSRIYNYLINGTIVTSNCSKEVSEFSDNYMRLKMQLTIKRRHLKAVKKRTRAKNYTRNNKLAHCIRKSLLHILMSRREDEM